MTPNTAKTLIVDDFEVYGERVKLDIWLKKWEMEQILKNQEIMERLNQYIKAYENDDMFGTGLVKEGLVLEELRSIRDGLQSQ